MGWDDIFECKIIRPTASYRRGEFANPEFFLLHDAGENETDIIDRVYPFIDPRVTVISLRGPLALGNGKYAWFDPQADDQALPSLPVVNLYERLYDFMMTGAFTGRAIDSHNWLYAEGQAGILAIYNYWTDNFSADTIVTVGTRFPKSLRQPLGSPRLYKYAKLYMAHGTDDSVVPVEEAREVRNWLLSTQPDIGYSEYQMGHQPTYECLVAVRKWLEPFTPWRNRWAMNVETA